MYHSVRDAVGPLYRTAICLQGSAAMPETSAEAPCAPKLKRHHRLQCRGDAECLGVLAAIVKSQLYCIRGYGWGMSCLHCLKIIRRWPCTPAAADTDRVRGAKM